MEYFYNAFMSEAWEVLPSSWGIFFLAVFIVGFSKTGLPGASIVAVPLMAAVTPAKLSVGVMLPLYMTADILSVWSWRRFANARYCFPYLLFVASGVWAASFVAGTVDDAVFARVIGWAVLLMLGLSLTAEFLRRRRGITDSAPSSGGPPLVSSAFFGLSAGLFSALANAAGPVVSLYMVTSRLDKLQILGTTAVCALVMNWIKVPLFVSLGMIRPATLTLDIIAIPVLLLGGLVGIRTAQMLPQAIFKNSVIFLAFLASLKLIL